MASPAVELDVDGIAVRLSSPDKIYYPQLGTDGGTKRHLVEYYRTVALQGAAVAALKDRPTHLQRFPDGIEGEEVYQKRLPAKRPEHVGSCEVTFPSGRKADVLRVQNAANIVWAANLGTITFHPWAVRCPDTDHPDELRIDLDPQPGTGFAEAVAIADEVLRPLLSELGLEGFPKTSGGRGLHVYIPLVPRWDFIEVRHAGIALAREVERRSGDRATTAWWKEERGERIFIDFNQNARDRTIAAAYSARKTPIATVSTPVTWDELRDVHPDDCTIATVPNLLADRGDPMAAMHEKAFELDVLLEMFEKDIAAGLGDLPYPPNYPKMPGEPKRVQPSRDRDRKQTETE
ncbi:ATP-dependent DNA ligase [Rhodococcus sp. AD45-ID]|uniref:non-homologous end-joining DNA ligase n=1 Tax=unclassified Rhodococcus (in: high G+C Gram-positive bacteria) TaxID=192944 RepID=UPI0005D40C03|nr:MULTISPECIES: non-homologous end-joining DNA ligase [unclassified Rhodococcus (in: high G+C Gram-positive bacteria)]KJF20873.1 putative DNA ligase-like protein [Rhodococcus sp. AD45]PSR38439.1 ATP-dependent DNA ligase [Rhodococcus sp. AD45-ID]